MICGSEVGISISVTGSTFLLRLRQHVRTERCHAALASAVSSRIESMLCPTSRAPPSSLDDSWIHSNEVCAVRSTASTRAFHQGGCGLVLDLVLSVVGNENKPSPYTFEQGKVIARAALGNYCVGCRRQSR